METTPAAELDHLRAEAAHLRRVNQELMVKSPANPGGTPVEVFDDFRKHLAANRAEFYRAVASGPFYGYNRPGAKASQAVIDNWWRQGMTGGAKAHYDGIKAFSETDFTEDLKQIDVPTLVLHGDDDQVVPIADSALLSVKLLSAAVPSGSGGLLNPMDLLFDSNGNLLVTSRPRHQVLRYGAASQLAFTVSLSWASAGTTTVNDATADGTALAGRDYTATSGTLTFPPGVTSQTVVVQTLDDSHADPTRAFTLNLSSPVGGVITSGQGIGTIFDDTKFYVVNDGGNDQTYQYASNGVALGNNPLTSGDTAPRGVATTAAGTTEWVVDANKNVYVYSAGGALLGSWAVGGLSSSAALTGIATNGTDLWLVDSYAAKVYKYTGAATRLSGSQSAASSFALANGHNGNGDPQDLVTDGASFWVVDGAQGLQVHAVRLVAGQLGHRPGGRSPDRDHHQPGQRQRRLGGGQRHAQGLPVRRRRRPHLRQPERRGDLRLEPLRQQPAGHRRPAARGHAPRAADRPARPEPVVGPGAPRRVARRAGNPPGRPVPRRSGCGLRPAVRGVAARRRRPRSARRRASEDAPGWPRSRRRVRRTEAAGPPGLARFGEQPRRPRGEQRGGPTGRAVGRRRRPGGAGRPLRQAGGGCGGRAMR
jgi:hypothetical protein